MNESGFSRRSRKSAPTRKAVLSDTSQRDRSDLRCRTGQAAVSISRDVLHGDRGECPPDRPKRPPRMSTPVCRGRSLRILRSSEKRDGVCCSIRGHTQIAEKKCRHGYDPYLEIRKARERLSLYKSKGDCAPDDFLSMDSDRDLQRYEAKLRRRYSEQGDFTGEIELERRQSELLRRQRDIDVGKTTEKYAEYVLKIPKPERQKHHPRTPNKFRVVSRRGWDGMIKKWRRDIHNYENLNSDETWHSLASDVSLSSNSRSPSPGHRAEELECATGPVRGGGEGGEPSTSQERRQPDEIENDEDTLQGGRKVTQSDAMGAGVTDDETLNDDDVKWNLRGRRVHIPTSGDVPSPDVIHSGLTNDLTNLGVKRGDLTFEDISAMLSPKKRTRTSRSRSMERPCRMWSRKRNPHRRA